MPQPPHTTQTKDPTKSWTQNKREMTNWGHAGIIVLLLIIPIIFVIFVIHVYPLGIPSGCLRSGSLVDA